MMRDTSIEVYRKIEANGLLSKRRFQVYAELFAHGPLSIADVRQKFRDKNFTMSDSSVSSRFSELERAGVVKIVGHKQDENTGNRVILWDVTSSMPVKIKRTSLKEKKRRLLEQVVRIGQSIPEPYRPDLRKLYMEIKSL